MRLICATDLSSRSDRAMRRAAALAREVRASLLFLCVVDNDQPAPLLATERKQAKALLTAQVGFMPEMRGLPPRIRVEAGDPFRVILQIAEEEGADLIIMGEHRRRLLLDMFVGTTIERVMRRGRCPVLMVNSPVMSSYDHVLAAVDMSEPSARALRAAVQLGFTRDARVTVLHAFQQLGRTSMAAAGLPEATIEGHAAETATQLRRDCAGYIAALSLEFEPSIVLEEGRPAEVLQRAVKRLTPDLVVIGTRGQGALGRAVLGSTAEEALRSLECDVLAVPPAAE